jgi:hypothetical protein
MTERCRHCRAAVGRPEGVARGLCRRCYGDGAVRAKYPPLYRPRKGRKIAYRAPAGETEADLDALVESRRATMPDQMGRVPEPYQMRTLRPLYRHNGSKVYG